MSVDEAGGVEIETGAEDKFVVETDAEVEDKSEEALEAETQRCSQDIVIEGALGVAGGGNHDLII